MKTNIFVAIAVVVVMLSPQQLLCQPPDTAVCKALVDGGVFDKYQTFSSRQVHEEIRRLLASQEFESYGAASSAQSSFGIKILDYLDAAFGSKTNDTNYAVRRAQFLSSSYSDFLANSTYASQLQAASAQLVSGFTQCISALASTNGFFAYVIPSKNLQSFAIEVRYRTDGVLRYDVTSITVQPKAGVSCEPKPPVTVTTGVWTASCTKPVDSTVQVTMNTTAGSLHPVDVNGLNDVLGDIRSEITTIRNSGALVAPGSVAFFDLQACPFGWQPFEALRGRYLVGVPAGGAIGASVGVALTNLENRAVGKHTHPYTVDGAYGWGGHDPGAVTMGGGPGVIDPSGRTTDPTGGVDGTTAPYLQLLPCRKQ